MLNWDDIDLPDGFTEESMLEMIKHVSEMKSWEYFNRRHILMGLEDLQQEIYLKCLKAMNRFDKNKIKNKKQVRRFFFTCADNHVKDLNRKNHFHHHIPCKKCPLACGLANWENNGVRVENGCTRFDNKLHCEDFSKYIMLKERKSSLGLGGGAGSSAAAAAFRVAGQSEGEAAYEEKNLDELIKCSVGKSTYRSYEKLKENNWDISKLNEEEAEQLTEAIGRIYDRGDLDA